MNYDFINVIILNTVKDVEKVSAWHFKQSTAQTLPFRAQMMSLESAFEDC